MNATAGTRFFRKVVVGPTVDSCWEWTGAKGGSGYGHFWFESRVARAHRVSYIMFVGAIPDGLVLDHLCGNPACVNPEHLEAVTAWENTLRAGSSCCARHALKTHCPEGHPYDRVGWRNARRCWTCDRRTESLKRARRRAAKAAA